MKDFRSQKESVLAILRVVTRILKIDFLLVKMNKEGLYQCTNQQSSRLKKIMIHFNIKKSANMDFCHRFTPTQHHRKIHHQNHHQNIQLNNDYKIFLNKFI